MSRTLSLRGVAREAMIAHARAVAPNECCGLLVGDPDAIDEAVPARNVAETPITRYVLDPADHFAVMRRARAEGRSVVGAYHSHPRSPAVPSPTDIAEAHYAAFVYVIVSLQGETPDLRGYLIDGGTVAEVRLIGLA